VWLVALFAIGVGRTAGPQTAPATDKPLHVWQIDAGFLVDLATTDDWGKAPDDPFFDPPQRSSSTGRARICCGAGRSRGSNRTSSRACGSVVDGRSSVARVRRTSEDRIPA
jgi:hypothetical protein